MRLGYTGFTTGIWLPALALTFVFLSVSLPGIPHFVGEARAAQVAKDKYTLELERLNAEKAARLTALEERYKQGVAKIKQKLQQDLASMSQSSAEKNHARRMAEWTKEYNAKRAEVYQWYNKSVLSINEKRKKGE